MNDDRTVAFLGTGLMGGPMARNLARAGTKVRAWNRSPEKAMALAPDVSIARSATEACAGAGAVVVMLSSGPVCREILFGEGGAAESLPENALLIVMSSVGWNDAQDMAKIAEERRLRWVDAPVSGGTPGAAAGTLSIMAGGSVEDVEAALPILSQMGSVVRIGPAGTGTLAKLVNQLTVATTIAAVSEALLLAEAGGADPVKVRKALMGGFAGSKILELHGKRMIDGNFVPGAPARHQLKDTRAAREVAGSLGLTLPVLDLVDELFETLVAQGGGDLDHSALLLELRRRNGREPMMDLK